MTSHERHAAGLAPASSFLPPAQCSPWQIRPLQTGDDLDAITRLIHAAYAPHLADGLKFWGTHQTVRDTAARFAQGWGWVAHVGEHAAAQVVGTITLRRPMPDSPCPIFRDAHTFTLGQFAVLPKWAGRGLGRALHDAALALALQEGARTLALDTAAPAAGLIALYTRWGYEVAGEVDWRPHTNYTSVVMARSVGGLR